MLKQFLFIFAIFYGAVVTMATDELCTIEMGTDGARGIAFEIRVSGTPLPVITLTDWRLILDAGSYDFGNEVQFWVHNGSDWLSVLDDVNQWTLWGLAAVSSVPPGRDTFRNATLNGYLTLSAGTYGIVVYTEGGSVFNPFGYQIYDLGLPDGPLTYTDSAAGLTIDFTFGAGITRSNLGFGPPLSSPFDPTHLLFSDPGIARTFSGCATWAEGFVAAPSVCGDGILDNTTEICDDFNVFSGDGCTSNCQMVENGYTCTQENGELSLCSTVCGNGVVLAPEQCDDNNTISGDGCSSECRFEIGYQCDNGVSPSNCTNVCGDRVLISPEECDNGNPMSPDPNDGCDSSCQVIPGFNCTLIEGTLLSLCIPICGDNMTVGQETCDDSNFQSFDGCSGTCLIEPGWDCNTASLPTVCTEICGDGVTVGAEISSGCDDNNTLAGDGCAPDCSLEAGWSCVGQPSICRGICGDGLLRGNEECDDNNSANTDGCDQACNVQTGWTCTQPNGVNSSTVCTTVCGDGLPISASGEECDDNNAQGGDGCSETCEIEDGFQCQGAPSRCTRLASDSGGIITDDTSTDIGIIVAIGVIALIVCCCLMFICNCLIDSVIGKDKKKKKKRGAKHRGETFGVDNDVNPNPDADMSLESISDADE